MILCLAGGSAAPWAQFTFPSSPHAPIPNLSPVGIDDSVFVDASVYIFDVNVEMRLTHTWTGDLVVTLTDPLGMSVTLMDRPGVPASVFGCSGDDPDIVADDHGTAGSIEDDCQGGTGAAYVVGGRYTPNEALAVLNTHHDTGFWTLRVADVAGGGDVGTFESWALHIDGVINPVEPPAGDAGIRLEVWPNPVDGSGMVRLVLRDPMDVRVVVVDLLGRPIDTLHDGPLGAGGHVLGLPDYPAGVYLARAVADGRPAARALIVSR